VLQFLFPAKGFTRFTPAVSDDLQGSQWFSDTLTNLLCAKAVALRQIREQPMVFSTFPRFCPISARIRRSTSSPEREIKMAAILTIFAGAFGFVAALISLAFGSSFLAALALWSITGLTAATLGLVWSFLPHRVPVRA
jgi:fatty acid desaturase